MKKGQGQAATKQLMSDTVYQALRTMVAERRFKPGQRLNVEELARELGVSRTPVWEAIRRLGQDGIVHNVPNRGVFMAENPLERVRDMLQVRGAMDRLAGRLAAERIDSRTVDQLSRCLPDQLRGIESGDVRLYLSADIRFHRLICEASGNVVLTNLYESITSHIFPTTFDLLSSLASLYVIHQEIIGGLSERDPQRVDEAVIRHSEILIAYLEAQMQAEAGRMEVVRRIKEAPSPARETRKGRSRRKVP